MVASILLAIWKSVGKSHGHGQSTKKSIQCSTKTVGSSQQKTRTHKKCPPLSSQSKFKSKLDPVTDETNGPPSKLHPAHSPVVESKSAGSISNL